MSTVILELLFRRDFHLQMLKFSFTFSSCAYITYDSLLTGNFSVSVVCFFFFWILLALDCLYLPLFYTVFLFPCCISEAIICTHFLPITATNEFGVLCQYCVGLYLHMALSESAVKKTLCCPSLASWDSLSCDFTVNVRGVCTFTLDIGSPEITGIMRTGWLWCRTALSPDAVSGHWSCLEQANTCGCVVQRAGEYSCHPLLSCYLQAKWRCMSDCSDKT